MSKSTADLVLDQITKGCQAAARAKVKEEVQGYKDRIKHLEGIIRNLEKGMSQDAKEYGELEKKYLDVRRDLDGLLSEREVFVDQAVSLNVWFEEQSKISNGFVDDLIKAYDKTDPDKKKKAIRRKKAPRRRKKKVVRKRRR